MFTYHRIEYYSYIDNFQLFKSVKTICSLWAVQKSVVGRPYKA